VRGQRERERERESEPVAVVRDLQAFSAIKLLCLYVYFCISLFLLFLCARFALHLVIIDFFSAAAVVVALLILVLFVIVVLQRLHLAYRVKLQRLLFAACAFYFTFCLALCCCCAFTPFLFLSLSLSLSLSNSVLNRSLSTTFCFLFTFYPSHVSCTLLWPHKICKLQVAIVFLVCSLLNVQ